MALLPLEIIFQMINEVAKNQDYASSTDLRRLRLVNKATNQAATPHLFHTVPLWLEKSSLQNLKDMSEHPEISKHVKRIVLSCLRFNDYAPEPENLIKAFSSSYDGLRQREKFLEAYGRCKEGQRWLAEDHRDVKFLTQAFRKLPLLKAIVVNETSLIGATQLRNELGASVLLPIHTTFDIYDYPLCDTVKYTGEYVLPALFEALARTPIPLQSFRIGEFGDVRSMDVPWRYRSVPETDNYYHTGVCWYAYRRIFSRTHGKVFTSFQEVEIEGLPDFPHMPFFVADLCCRCPKLKTLSLGRLMGTDYEELAQSERLFSTFTLQFLENLMLRQFQFSVDSLVSFLARHASNLTEVYFFDCNLLGGGTWSSLFELLRESVSFPQLTEFDVNDVSACDYLNHRDHINPGIVIDENDGSETGSDTTDTAS